VTSHALEHATAASADPPPASPGDAPGLSPAEAEELRHRLVIGVALGVHSGDLGSRIAPGSRAALAALPVVKTLLGTLLPVAQPWHVYRFYFAYDHNDAVYERPENRAALEAEFAERFAAEDARRWHPPGGAPGAVDGSRLVHSVHWVHCDYSGKPAWAHSDAVVAAYKEGADYVFRTNDDSAFPKNPDWADTFVATLRGREPPNLGVVGPTCHEGANWILTHDFTHKTHVALFGWQYPRSLPDWSSDDWVTFVYGQFGLMTKLPDVLTAHTLELGTRYVPQAQAARLATLNAELAAGAQVIRAHLLERGLTKPFEAKVVTCC